jgi:hypothetical protein
MADEQKDPTSLNYAGKNDHPPSAMNRAGLLIAGLFCGAICTIFVGVILEIARNGNGNITSRVLLSTLSIGVAVICLVKAIRLLAGDQGRWFLIGILLGVGITGLLEGVCFAAI